MTDALDPEKLRKAFAALAARVAELEVATGIFAPERELDTERGNPAVKFPPRGWGDEWKGKRFSECPPDFLDALAESLTYSAAHPKPGREKFVEWNRLDAARARSWRRRILAGGWTPPPKPEKTARSTRERPARAERPRTERAARGRPSFDASTGEVLDESREHALPHAGAETPPDTGDGLFDDDPAPGAHGDTWDEDEPPGLG